MGSSFFSLGAKTSSICSFFDCSSLAFLFSQPERTTVNRLTHKSKEIEMNTFFKVNIFLLLCMVAFMFVVPAYAEANTTGYNSGQSITQDTNVLSKITHKYYAKANSWGDGLTQFAKRLFRWFLLLDILMFSIAGGLGIAYGSKNGIQVLGEFAFMVVLPASFMFVVINKYQSWSQEIIKGFSFIASNIEPTTLNIGSSSFFAAGITLFDKCCASISITSPSTYALILVGVIIVICYALMAMQILMIKCESYIMLNAGIIILALGAFSMTRQYAINFMRYVLSVAVKLYVMQLIIGIAFSFVDEFTKTSIQMTDLTVVLGASVVMLGLIRCIPDICAGIIQGQHVSSGNALAGAVASVGGGVTGAGAAIMGSASAGAAIKAAASEAGAAGGSPLRQAANFGKLLAGAAAETALGDKAQNSFTGHFGSKLAQKVAASSMKRGADS